MLACEGERAVKVAPGSSLPHTFQPASISSNPHVRLSPPLREGGGVVSITLNVLLQPNHPQVGLLDGHAALAILAFGLAILQAKRLCCSIFQLKFLALPTCNSAPSTGQICGGSAG